MAATGRKRPEPLTIPKESKTSYFITNSGTFQEGDLVISRDGLVIGDSDSPASTRTCSSRGSTFSSRGPSRDRSSSRQGSAPRTGANGAVEEPSPRVAADEGEPFGVALDDLEELGVIGHGSSGVVRKVRHRATGHLLVLKVIPFDVQCDQLRKQVTTELRTLHGSCNKAIVKNYQSFFDSGAITIVMEYMDGGSLANVLKSNSRIPEIYLAEISRQVLEGLLYLHKELRVVHRDIKPSNLLLNSRGEMKISDFGVSHQLANSVSKCQSWVGTVTYMSPERIAGGPYSVDSDVWSFALTIVECALGRFPYPPQQEDGGYAPVALGFWDLLDFIVSEPAPILPPDQFSPELCDFVNSCLKKDPEKRATCEGLLQHPFLQKYKKVNLADLLLAHG